MRSPGRGFWGQVLLEEDLVDLARDGQFGLELADTSLRGRELHLPLGAEPRLLAAVDPLLPQPVVDRRLAHAERLGELRDPRAGARQVDHLLAHLCWIPAGHWFLLAERRRIPETPLR